MVTHDHIGKNSYLLDNKHCEKNTMTHEKKSFFFEKNMVSRF